jgi:hypothetical protein
LQQDWKPEQQVLAQTWLGGEQHWVPLRQFSAAQHRPPHVSVGAQHSKPSQSWPASQQVGLTDPPAPLPARPPPSLPDLFPDTPA